jgi:hypothetical protein
MLETIKHNNVLIAIIIYSSYKNEGISFVTPQESLLQLGYMARPAGYRIVPHTHNPVQRQTVGTQEVLLIKSGVIRIDFYSFEQVFLESRKLSAGDVILLSGAGHGIDVLEDAVIVEVKNGPFIEGSDKGRFGDKGKKAQ